MIPFLDGDGLVIGTSLVLCTDVRAEIPNKVEDIFESLNSDEKSEGDLIINWMRKTLKGQDNKIKQIKE